MHEKTRFIPQFLTYSFMQKTHQHKPFRGRHMADALPEKIIRLKKQLAKTARFVSEKIVSGKADLLYIVKPGMLDAILRKRGDPPG